MEAEAKKSAPPPADKSAKSTKAAAKVETRTVNQWELAQLVAEGNLQPHTEPHENLGPRFAGVLDGVEIYLEG